MSAPTIVGPDMCELNPMIDALRARENDELKHWARESGRLSLCGGFFCLVKSPGKLLEDDHLLVRNLAEISGISTDGAEKLVVFEADNVIGLAAQLVGQNQFFGISVCG